MLLFLFFFNIQSLESFKTNLLRRKNPVEVEKSSSFKRTKNSEDTWYFIHFNAKPDLSLLSKHGIEIKTSNMINRLWYSLFLTPNQAQYLTNFASLRPVSDTEKIIDFNAIKFSESLQIETSSTFDLSLDLKSFNDDNLFVYKHDKNLYQFTSSDNGKLANFLSSNGKVYSISPKNNTIFFNNRAAGFTQLNTKKAVLSGKSNDIVTVDRHLEAKGLNGEGQVILVEDTYLDPNSTFFYDPNHPLFEKNRYYDDHRKLKIIFDEFNYKEPRANEHGTHVAGCAAGSSHLPASESDMSLFDGVAPKAKIAFYQGGMSGIYNSERVAEIVRNTRPCACTNSWGYRSSSMSDDNQWNKNAQEMNETLFLFAAGNFGKTNNKNLDYYETLTSPSAGKNLLTVGALSSIPIDEKSDAGEVVIGDAAKSIYFFEVNSQQTYKPQTKAWSLKSGSVSNPGADLLFSEGSVELKMTKNMSDNFKEKQLILIIEDRSGFDAIDKQNPPLVLLTKTDFDIDNFETLGFVHLFPVLVLDNETVELIYNMYGHSVEVETNLVTSSLTSLRRAPFSSKGLSMLGLMKPDIVAPGTAYFSARSDPAGGLGHADIAIMDGTSMAAPNVAGAAALVSQYFVDKRYRSAVSIKPSSSLLRAVLINAADPLDSDKLCPDADTGFGSLNLGAYILTSVKDGNDENVLVSDGVAVIGDEHIVAEVEVKDSSRDFRVTISYLDETLSDDSSAALAVDLDLVVITPDGSVIRGNQRLDGTEEMFSTNERVVIKKGDVKPGKYEIHVLARVPEIVPGRRTEFSIAVFGPISDSSRNSLTFGPAKTCLPVVEGHGKCNEETKLNECIFDDLEAYTGHSCQTSVITIVDSGKQLFELEPFGAKYVNIFYPFDAVFENLTITIASATEFHPKYAYTLNATGMRQPMHELDADSVLTSSDLSMTIYNHGQAIEWQAESCLLTLVYNKSPKKTTFIVGYQINIEYSNPDETPTPEPTAVITQPPDVPCTANDDGESFFIPFIIAVICCIIMFIVVVILGIIILKPKKSTDRSEVITESLKSPLF